MDKSRDVKLKDWSKDFRVQKSLVRFNNLMKQPFRVYSPVYSPTVIMTPTPLNTVQVVAAPQTISVPVETIAVPAEPSIPKPKKKTIKEPLIGPRNLKTSKKPVLISVIPKQQIDDLSDLMKKI